MARKRKNKEQAEEPKVQRVEERETEGSPLSDIKFKALDGQTVQLMDVLDESHIMAFDGHGVTKYKVSYPGVKALARAAGIKANYYVDVRCTPSLENKMTTIVSVTLYSAAEKDSNAVITKLGEASDENTKGIAKLYKATMAEKRAYVRGVLELLGLDNMYGEDEFSGDEEKTAEPELSSTDYQAISKYADAILKAKTSDELEEAGEEIKEVADELNATQTSFLRRHYSKRDGELSAGF